MLRRWLCQADVTLTITPVDPLLVKSGYATIDGPDMVPVSTFVGGKKTYYLPGTSLKGVLRSHFERVCRSLVDGSVCLPYYQPRKDVPIPVESERASTGCGWVGEDDDPKCVFYRRACAACRLFGSLRFAGRFSIGDAYPLPGREPKQGARNGVGIDRFTGGTVPGVLFDLVVLEGGAFRADVRLTNFELWQLAALYFLLTDLRDELLAVGSGRSRGLGRVRGEVTDFRLTYLRPLTALSGLADLATAEEGTAYGLHAWRPAAVSALPPPRRRGLRHEHDLTGGWAETLAPLADGLADFLQRHTLAAARA